MEGNKKLRCPACNAPLFYSGRKEYYETLCEHVMEPNENHPLRRILNCPTEDCELSKLVFWEPGGGWYHEEGPPYMTTEDLMELIQGENLNAVNSICWEIERDQLWHKDHTTRIKLWKVAWFDIRFGERPEWMVDKHSPWKYCFGVVIAIFGKKRTWRKKLFAKYYGSW